MKKTMKSGLSFLIAVAMCLSLFSMAALAADTPSSWAQVDVDKAITAKLVPQALQAQYTQAITRGEFCALAVALYETVNGTEISERTTFNDTTDLNVEKAAAIGVVSGVGDNHFSPNAGLTREQAATMLARLAEVLGKPLAKQAANFSDNASIAAWALEAVGQIQAWGVMSGIGDNAFAPQDAYTREQSMVTALRLYDLVKAATPKADTPKADTPKTDTPKTDTPKTDTPKTDTPKTDTPKTDTQPQASSCLKTNQEYGPFTMYDYSGDKLRRQTDISSFIATKLELSSIEKYKMNYSIAGKSTKDDYHFFLCFYNDSGTEIGRQLISDSVPPNQAFTRSDYAYIEPELIEKSANVGFVSSSGDLADQPRSGGSSDDSNNNDKDDSGSDKNDESNKFSRRDATNMNTWANAASKAANQCIGYASKAISAATSSDSTRSALYIDQSKNCAQTAKDNLLKILDVLNNRVEVTRQDGKSATQICQEAITEMDEIINFESATDVVGYSLKTINASKCLEVQKFAVDLYGIFSNE